ncbi:MAG: hypothetical protein M3Y80_11930, partial [Verrucomicrobiota bacterium]|nr:hypothetical protein [Verrucomicrobiota bacterium]
MWKCTLLCLCAGLSQAPAANIDFTPTVTEELVEGFSNRHATVQADTGNATFLVPRGWDVRGSKEALRLAPPQKDFCEGVFQAVALPAEQTFDALTLAALEQKVRSGLPTNAQQVEIADRQENPASFGQNLSYQFIVSYKTLGRDFQRSVIFVNAGDTQMIFRFTAPKEEFSALHRVFLRSITSW